MDNFEDEMKRFTSETDEDRKLMKIAQRPIELTLFFAYIVAGIISLDMHVVYNTAMFIFAVTRFVSRTDYTKYVTEYLRIKFDYMLYLNYDKDERENSSIDLKKIKWDDLIDKKRKYEIFYAIILTIIYVVTPITSFTINHLISSVINVAIIWWYVIAEGKRIEAAKKAYMLGNNIIARKEQLEK